MRLAPEGHSGRRARGCQGVSSTQSPNSNPSPALQAETLAELYGPFLFRKPSPTHFGLSPCLGFLHHPQHCTLGRALQGQWPLLALPWISQLWLREARPRPQLRNKIQSLQLPKKVTIQGLPPQPVCPGQKHAGLISPLGARDIKSGV